jgi:glutamate-1-semialdehyde aminotransferase/spore coat polysaccharide biosynthesis protein SpsF (cytidylyltransferase family)
MNLVIIQARYSSTRFPGKILKKINGKSLLEILILRVKKSKLIDKIIIATTNDKNDNKVINKIKKLNVDTYRGSINNVLKRYFCATKKFNKTIKNVIRITSDCPLIDSKLIDKIVLKHEKNNNDYTSNTLVPTFPDGMDIEVFKYEALKKAFKFAKTKFEKEHVTPFIKSNKKFKRMNIKSSKDFSKLRLTIDYEEDLKLLKKIFQNFNYDIYVSYIKILNYLKKNEKIQKINNQYIRDEGSIMSSANKLWKKAKTIIPGGAMLFSKRQEVFLPDHWPTYFSKSKGCTIWDLDKKKYYDLSLMGVGTNLLGYSNSKVDKFVEKTVKKGNMTTLNCPEEVKLAETLIDMHPWSDMAKFTRSGGEANAVAIRIARTFSKKKKIMVCGYHGWHDWYLSSKIKNQKLFNNHLPKSIKTNGVPSTLGNDIFIFKYNDIENFINIYKKNKNQIGIVKMEVSRNYPPNKNYLEFIRKFCDKEKLLLIFDECTSGFRETYGGLHLKYNVNPDILILGKALGNGYAINAIIVKKFVMKFAEKTHISSTFWTERIGPTAALATLKEMKRIKSWKYVTKYGSYIKSEWSKIFKENNLKTEINGLDSMPVFNFKQKKMNQAYKSFIILEMLKKGFLTSNSLYVSTAHTPHIINKYLKNFSEVIKKLKIKIQNKSLLINTISKQQINR